MRRLADACYQLAMVAWIGGLWAIGYIVAPVLFASLADRQLAGLLAGKLFAIIGWVGLGAAAYLLIFISLRRGVGAFRSGVFWLIVLVAALTAASQFGIQPLMAQLKADAFPRDVMESVMRDRFVAWHGISSVLYLMQSLLGAWLVLWSGRGLR